MIDTGFPVKIEDAELSDGYNTADSTDSESSYRCPAVRCPNQRSTKPNGSLRRFCERHRLRGSRDQSREQQRRRLIQYIVSALQDGDPITSGMPTSANTETSRPRPRLVLLGNQQTLILGVVLSDRGAAAASELAGLRRDV